MLTIVVGLGALAGIYLRGRTADRLLGRGWINARVIVPAIVLLTIPNRLRPGGGHHLDLHLRCHYSTSAPRCSVRPTRRPLPTFIEAAGWQVVMPQGHV